MGSPTLGSFRQDVNLDAIRPSVVAFDEVEIRNAVPVEITQLEAADGVLGLRERGPGVAACA